MEHETGSLESQNNETIKDDRGGRRVVRFGASLHHVSGF
jgi:hypothetical protein